MHKVVQGPSCVKGVDKCNLALFDILCYCFRMAKKKKLTTLSEAGKIGIQITNSMLTPETRSAAAKKGWKLRKERLAAEK